MCFVIPKLSEIMTSTHNLSQSGSFRSSVPELLRHLSHDEAIFVTEWTPTNLPEIR